MLLFILLLFLRPYKVQLCTNAALYCHYPPSLLVDYTFLVSVFSHFLFLSGSGQLANFPIGRFFAFLRPTTLKINHIY